MAFTVGVYEIYPVADSEDMVIWGSCKGTVKIGSASFLTNPGVDNDVPFSTTVIGIEIPKEEGWESVTEATDCFVCIKLQNASKALIKKATVLHDHEATYNQKHDSYINALGDGIVVKADMEMTTEVMESLTFTDLCELLRLYHWYHNEVKPAEFEEEKAKIKAKQEALALYTSSRLFAMDEIYVVGSVNTGEPYMYVQMIKNEENILVTPPNIRLITKAYIDRYRLTYSAEEYEFFRVDNGADKNGIKRFLTAVFLENGVCGVEFLNEDFVIKADNLVPTPDFSGRSDNERPIFNPGIVRWMLLMGQMPAPETDEQKQMFNAFYRFFCKELPNARLIVPTKENGTVTARRGGEEVKGKNLTPAVQHGTGRDAMKLYTDINRLNRMFSPDEWTGVVTTVGGVIGKFDCLINATNHPRASIFISQEMYSEMIKNQQ